MPAYGAGARQGRRDVALAQRARGRPRLLPRRRRPRVPGALRARAARPAARVRRDRLRQGLLPPPVPPGRGARSPTAAGASTTCSRAPRSRSSTRRWPVCASRLPARSPRGARCSSGSRSRPATASRSRCCSTCYEQVGLDGMAQVDLDSHHNSHQPLLELTGMAYAVLRVLAARLEREGRLLELDPSPLLLERRRLASRRCSNARRWPASGERGALPRPRRHAAWRRGVAAARRRRAPSRCLGCARSRPACGPTIEVVLMSGRRRAQVAEDARLLGQSAFIYEAGCVLELDGEELWMTELVPGERSVHEQIDDSGAPVAPARALRRAARVPRPLASRARDLPPLPRPRRRG